MRLLDFFFALRPLVLVPAWTFFLLGAAAGTDPFPAIRAAALTLVLCGGYLVNQIVDFETDRLNDKGFFLQRGIFTRRAYGVAASLFVVSGLTLALGFRESPLQVLVAAVLVLAYSVPPLRLCARPGADLLANAAGYGVLAPWIGAGSAPLPAPVAVACALAVGAVFVHTTLLDAEGDRRTGKRTTGVVLGPRAARGLATVLAFGAAAASGFAVRDAEFIGLASASFLLAVLCLANAVAAHRVSSRTVCTAASAAFALAACVLWPAFALILVALTVMTRWYYRRRFSLAYPSL
jgi:4-hydroxybenzoate polyprenyltransferase